jgi:hypothetical protein
MAHVYSASPWFEPVGAVLNASKAQRSERLSPEAQAMAEYLMDAEVGSAAHVTARHVTRTPVRISKAAHISYLADMDQQWRHDRIETLRKGIQR